MAAHSYASLVGVGTGLSLTRLSGAGWALGAMPPPAARAPLLGRTVAQITDGEPDLATLLGIDAGALSAVATDLGYVDQAHSTRDVTTATGLAPGQFLAEPRREPPG